MNSSLYLCFQWVLAGGGGGEGGSARSFQTSRTSLLFKQYLRNFATLTKFIGEQDFVKMFC